MASNMEKQQSVQGNTKSDTGTPLPFRHSHPRGPSTREVTTVGLRCHPGGFSPSWEFPRSAFSHSYTTYRPHAGALCPQALSDPQAQLCLSLLGPHVQNQFLKGSY